jgi:hypothetical protein
VRGQDRPDLSQTAPLRMVCRHRAGPIRTGSRRRVRKQGEIST